jgi:hypothetical protein
MLVMTREAAQLKHGQHLQRQRTLPRQHGNTGGKRTINLGL